MQRRTGLMHAGCVAGAAMFDMEYGRWTEENYKHMAELRGGLLAQLPDSELRLVVNTCLANYDEVFRLKAAAAKVDVFHILSGTWKSPAERCFLWLGGFLPSDLIKVRTRPYLSSLACATFHITFIRL